MAKYRQIHTSYWEDGFVLDLTPEEKYFYLYIMTNPKTTQCGIYELPKRIIETQTGYNRETVDKLLQRFIDYGKIDYFEGTKELMILKWIKYNPPSNTNAIKCIISELKEVKYEEFRNRYLSMCNEYEEYDKEGLIRGYVGAIKGLPSNKVINNKEEVISKEEEITTTAAGETPPVDNVNIVDKSEQVIKLFDENIQKSTPLESNQLTEWCSEVEPEVVMTAITEAVMYNAKSMAYIKSLIDSWKGKGIKTKVALDAYKLEVEKEKATKKGKQQGKKKGSNDGTMMIGDRKYNTKDLEDKLLGRKTEEGG